MQIVIDIPEEFESHFNSDRFKDSFERLMLIYEIELCNKHGSDYDALSGNYEIETLRMVRDALQNSMPLTEGHGRMGDLDELEKRIRRFINHYKDILQEQPTHYEMIIHILDGIMQSRTIIEADKEEENDTP